MKKGLLTFLILFTSLISANAAKSTGEPHAFVQPDGTTLMVQLLGDENFSWYQTIDGVLLKRVDKAFYIAKTTSDGTLQSSGIIAHNLDSRKQAETTVAESQDKSLFFANGGSSSQKAKSIMKSIAGYPKSYFCPHSGTIRVPIIMINYTDTVFTFPDKEVWEEYFNGETRFPYSKETRFKGYSSVAQYFKDASNGDLNFVFDIFGPYTASKNHNHYGHNSGKGTSNELTLLQEAVELANGDIDFTEYDSNNDGRVDMVYVLYAGTGANLSGDENDFWPSCFYTTGQYVEADKMKISILGGANELAVSAAKNDGTAIRAGIGVTCHEMSHGMGLPDLYWTSASIPTDSLGYTDYNNCGPEDWDLMDGGENLYNAMWPCQYAAWEKDIMGWITPEELTEPTDVTIYPLNKEDGKAYKVVNPDNEYEYYIIENYQPDEWNGYVTGIRYGAGLMITHVNTSNSGFSMSPNTTYGKPSVTLVPADGFLLAAYSVGKKMQYKGQVVQMPQKTDLDANGKSTWLYTYFIPDSQGDPYLGSKYTGDPITSVAAYKNYTKNEAGEDMVVKYPITDITRNEDGSISFKFMGGTPSAISNITIDENANENAPIYATDGCLVGSDRSSLPHGLYIQNGHKFIK